MRTKYLLFTMFLFFSTFALEAQNKTTKIDTIKEYFQEIKSITYKNKSLWDLDLYGPLLIVDPYTRKAYSNYADTLGVLKEHMGIYIGILPNDILLGNISTKWGGRTWAMILNIFIDDNLENRVDLLSHELFHRVQSKLGFERVNDGNNQHLDSKDGRIYICLELTALLEALKTKNITEANMHVLNALKFRKYRYQLYPTAYESEATIEMNEGIASYTGKVHRGLNQEGIYELMNSKIKEFLDQPSYVQLFAYQTVPAYGFLLAQNNKFWNKEVISEKNLTDYFNYSFSYQPSDLNHSEIMLIGKQYAIDYLITKESKREEEIKKQIAIYKQNFINEPHLTIPFEKKRVAYDTRYIVTIENFGFVYPTLTATDNWGTLEVKEVGGFLNQEKTSITVTNPNIIEEGKIKGEGWTLELNDGYEIIKNEESGNYILVKTNSEK